MAARRKGLEVVVEATKGGYGHWAYYRPSKTALEDAKAEADWLTWRCRQEPPTPHRKSNVALVLDHAQGGAVVYHGQCR